MEWLVGKRTLLCWESMKGLFWNPRFAVRNSAFTVRPLPYAYDLVVYLRDFRARRLPSSSGPEHTVANDGGGLRRLMLKGELSEILYLRPTNEVRGII